MYTNKPIRMHSECLEILTKIQKANNELEDTKSRLRLYDATDDISASIKLWHKRVDFTSLIEQQEGRVAKMRSEYENAMDSLFANNIANQEAV